MLTTAMLVLTLGKVWDLPLVYVAHRADLIVIASVAGPRSQKSELGFLHVERVLKGPAVDRVTLLDTGSPDFACDITNVQPGEHALFLLERAEGGYRIMHFGRGKLPLSRDGQSVEFFARGELFVSGALETRCLGKRCPLDGVLAELRPWLVAKGATAFYIDGGAVVSTRPSAELSCRDGEYPRQLACNGGGTPPGDVDLLCYKNGAICLQQKRSSRAAP